ncbi:MAG: hypothetical protein P8Y80_15220 [Acidobacteriota bacterium]
MNKIFKNRRTLQLIGIVFLSLPVFIAGIVIANYRLDGDKGKLRPSGPEKRSG